MFGLALIFLILAIIAGIFTTVATPFLAAAKVLFFIFLLFFVLLFVVHMTKDRERR